MAGRPPTPGALRRRRRRAHAARHRGAAARLRRRSSPSSPSASSTSRSPARCAPSWPRFGAWITALWPVAHLVGPQVGALRRPAAAARRRAAQRARPGHDPPAGPRRRAGSAARHPAQDAPVQLLWATRRAWRCSSPCCWSCATTGAVPATPTRWRWSASVLLALPAAAAGGALRGQRRQDLDPGGRVLHPARRVRQDLPDRLLRRLPGGQARRAVAGQPAGRRPRAAPRPRPRPGARGLGAVHPRAGLRARPGHARCCSSASSW